MKASAPFNDSRKELLKDPELAAMYLEESLEEGDMKAFKQALKHVAEARLGGVTELSRTTHLNREALYRALSEKGNPRLDTLGNSVSGNTGQEARIAWEIRLFWGKNHLS